MFGSVRRIIAVAVLAAGFLGSGAAAGARAEGVAPASVQTVQYYHGARPYAYPGPQYARPYYRPYPRYYARRFYGPPPRPFYHGPYRHGPYHRYYR